ncbi:unnamed protein product [Macrosiphum euphorbiae]|uniref:Uncharacterized protein n=1 Tax=Macrosiphum euphorbiae TaxID=13131 RepID=A0AAV0WB65_9HEMI|nr:unnamed protein product [Macrosiphum euphorbiae]
MLSNDNGGAENTKTTNTNYDYNSIARFTSAEHITTISAEAMFASDIPQKDGTQTRRPADRYEPTAWKGTTA